MRPISSFNFGPDAGRLRVRYHDGSSVVTGYIVKQLSHNRYRVTSDGLSTFDIALAQTTSAADNLSAGFGTIRVFVESGGGAFFTSLLGANAVAVHSGGIGYNIGDEVGFLGGTSNASTRLTVSAVSGGAITATTYVQRGRYSDLPGTIVGSARRCNATTITGGGSGAVFNVTFQMEELFATSPGTGYLPGQDLNVTGGGGVPPTAYIFAVDAEGAITNFGIPSFGSGLINMPVITVSTATQRVARLWSARCTTVEGLNIPWSRIPATNGMAQLETI